MTDAKPELLSEGVRLNLAINDALHWLSRGDIDQADEVLRDALAATPSSQPDDAVVERVAGEIANRLWPILGGNHADADMWTEIGAAITEGVRAALANLPPPPAKDRSE